MPTRWKSGSAAALVKWYNKLHSDSAEYKMWGNGIALPCASFVLGNIAKWGARNMQHNANETGDLEMSAMIRASEETAWHICEALHAMGLDLRLDSSLPTDMWPCILIGQGPNENGAMIYFPCHRFLYDEKGMRNVIIFDTIAGEVHGDELELSFIFKYEEQHKMMFKRRKQNDTN